MIDATKVLSSPLSIVNEAFQAHVQQNGVNSLATSSDWGVSGCFKKFMDDPSFVNSVPSINVTPLEHIKPGSLVRYRCLVQDMLDPEYYLGVYAEVTPTGESRMVTGKYRDSPDVTNGCTISDDGHVTYERQPLYCVPIPGETPWAREALMGRFDTGDGDNPPPDYVTESPRATKRPFNADGEEDVGGYSPDKTFRKAKPVKIQCANSEETPSPSAAPAAEKAEEENKERLPYDSPEHPLIDPNQVTCLVKIYDEEEAVRPKMCDTIEVFGIVALDPWLAETSQDDFAMGEVAMPPASKVPRLHCFAYRKVDRATLIKPVPQPATNHDILARQIFLQKFLIPACGNDALVAEYILNAILAQTVARPDGLVLGKLVINITNVSPASDLGTVLQTVLSLFLPAVVNFPLTLENLNSRSLYPRKNYNTGRLVASALQLMRGTLLLLDETALQPGQLGSKGVQNIQVLNTLTSRQVLPYDFEYFQTDFNVDLPTIILSEGKSLCPADVRIPWKPTATPALPPAVLDVLTTIPPIRSYLGSALAAYQSYTLTEEITQHVEEDFVHARQSNPQTTSEDFHRWLDMGRLCASSHLEGGLSKDRWATVKSMETERFSRLVQAGQVQAPVSQ